MTEVEYLSPGDVWASWPARLRNVRAAVAYWQSGGAHDFPKTWQDWRPYEFAFRWLVDVTICPGAAYTLHYSDGSCERTISYDTVAILRN